jgi:hypothetical protein
MLSLGGGYRPNAGHYATKPGRLDKLIIAASPVVFRFKASANYAGAGLGGALTRLSSAVCDVVLCASTPN